MNYIKEIVFDCPNCKSKKVGHSYCRFADDLEQSLLNFKGKIIYKIICNHCEYKRLVFLNDKRDNIERTIYPILPKGEPLPDCIDEGIRKDFDEARMIVNYSVRCAVGLLRICSEKLCNFIGDKYITDENIKKEIKEKQNTLQPKINLLIKYRQDYFSFIDEPYIKQLEILKDAGNNSLHSREILEEYTEDDFNTLCAIIVAISKTIALKDENDKSIDKVKQKNDNNKKK